MEQGNPRNALPIPFSEWRCEFRILEMSLVRFPLGAYNPMFGAAPRSEGLLPERNGLGHRFPKFARKARLLIWFLEGTISR